MKPSLFTLLSLLTIAAFPAVSNAGFMDNLEGSYSVGGKKCKLDSVTTVTGKASITPNASGAVVRLRVLIGSTFETEIPLSFKNGKGDIKNTKMEGDIISLPVTRRTVWNTDEVNRKSTLEEYEGVGIAKQTGAYSLSEENNGTVTLTIKEKASDLDSVCTLTRN